jgi:hypothetical protein
VFLIPVTNTVVDPWAMMVHSSDTLLASGAMMTLWNLYFITLFAHSLENRFDMHYLLHAKVIVVFNRRNNLVFTLFPIFI